MRRAKILFLIPGLVPVLLLSRRRQDFLAPWIYLGLASFLAISSPYIT
jgi:4-amino-4-deoxy-L-arabinose transferase-like glycosyltransferase